MSYATPVSVGTWARNLWRPAEVATLSTAPHIPPRQLAAHPPRPAPRPAAGGYAGLRVEPPAAPTAAPVRAVPPMRAEISADGQRILDALKRQPLPTRVIVERLSCSQHHARMQIEALRDAGLIVFHRRGHAWTLTGADTPPPLIVQRRRYGTGAQSTTGRAAIMAAIEAGASTFAEVQRATHFHLTNIRRACRDLERAGRLVRAHQPGTATTLEIAPEAANRLRPQILDALERAGKPLSAAELARRCPAAERSRPRVACALCRLRELGVVMFNGDAWRFTDEYARGAQS